MDNARRILVFVGSALAAAFLIAAIAPGSDADVRPRSASECSSCQSPDGE